MRETRTSGSEGGRAGNCPVYPTATRIGGCYSVSCGLARLNPEPLAATSPITHRRILFFFAHRLSPHDLQKCFCVFVRMSSSSRPHRDRFRSNRNDEYLISVNLDTLDTPVVCV